MTDTGAREKDRSRSRAQRERILAAAQTCFVQSGFHAASMAQIAETAGMSPGLIYRYFDSKNAIILAIIQAQLEVARERIARLRASEDLAAGMLEHCQRCNDGNRQGISAPLFLEMSAEATRDPQICEALSKFDSTIRADLARRLSRPETEGGYGLPAEVAEVRAMMLVCIIEGLKVREAREPELDNRLLCRVVDDALRCLLAPAEGD